jgi:DNA-binding transcriptional ArsR family regulator
MMEEVNWSALNKILNDPTRRSILGLLAENQTLSYTEMMTILHITNTGKLNYHLKLLGALIAKDEEGKYYLTERGKLAASLIKTFPGKEQSSRYRTVRIVAVTVLALMGISLIFFGAVLSISTAHTLEHQALDLFLVVFGAIVIGIAIFLFVWKSRSLRERYGSTQKQSYGLGE